MLSYLIPKKLIRGLDDEIHFTISTEAQCLSPLWWLQPPTQARRFPQFRGPGGQRGAVTALRQAADSLCALTCRMGRRSAGSPLMRALVPLLRAPLSGPKPLPKAPPPIPSHGALGFHHRSLGVHRHLPILLSALIP